MSGKSYYIFNFVTTGPAPHERAVGLLRAGMWGVDAQEPHGSAIAAGDLVLIYLAAPERVFIGRAELASPVHDWTRSEAHVYPGDSAGGVLLSRVEEWEPPVPMDAVLAQIASETARGDFEAGVVRISAHEYGTTLAVAALSRSRLVEDS
jgi:hypothetical protein